MFHLGGASDTPEPLRPLNKESHRLLLEIHKEFDRSIELIRGGSLLVALNEAEIKVIEPYVQDMQQVETECRFMDGEEARRFEPLLGPQVTAAFYNPVNYHVNPFRLCQAYLSAALRREGSVSYGTCVRDVQMPNARMVRVITEQGVYEADWVVVAGGAHTPQILSNIGIEIPIAPARGQVIITEACPLLTERTLSFLDHLYIKQTASGNFYLGSHTEFVGFDKSITLEKITAYIRVLARAVPLLARLRALRFFTGFRPLCDDELPIIGPIPGGDHLIIASGHGRSGMLYSAVTGKIVSELIVDGKSELPIDAFSVNRFAKGSKHL
jgi:glycine/D-amino acid oxidase-like deaminating enzyme